MRIDKLQQNSYDNTCNLAANILIDAGYPVKNGIIQDGELHRFGKNKNQWYVCFENYIVAKDWQGNLPAIKQAVNESKYAALSIEEKENIKRKVADAQLKAENERQKRQEIVALKAAKIWESLRLEGSSKYLESKQLVAVGEIRFGNNRNGNFIAVTLRDSSDAIWNLQFIYDNIPEGRSANKLFLSGGKKAGCYAQFGNDNSRPIYICEGVATGLSIHEAKPDSMVIIAFDCYNLDPVIENILKKYPNEEIVIAADNDSSKPKNIGIEKAEATAKKFNLKIAKPVFENASSKFSDFNDLHQLKGLNAVQEQLNIADYVDPEPMLFSSLNHPEIEFDAEDVLGKNVLTIFAKEVSRSTETPIEFALISAFACLAACVQDKFVVRLSKDRKEPLVLQAIIFGRSGEGKSPVFNHIVRPILECERRKMPDYEKKLKEIQNFNKMLDAQIQRVSKPSAKKDQKNFNVEEADKQIQKLENKRKPEPVSPRIIVQDITPEQISKKLKVQGGKIAIVDHEGGVFSTLAGRYSNGIPNIDVLLKGYDGSELMVTRADRDIDIPAAYASTCIFIQPEVFLCTQNLQQFIHSGFLGRAIYANPKSKVGYRKFDTFEISQESQDNYRELINKFFELKKPDSNDPYELGLAQDAKDIFRNFELELEPKRKSGEEYGNNAIGAWVEKSKRNAVRIAGIIQLVENFNSHSISKETLLKAISLIRILTAHASCVFNHIGNDVRTADAIKLWEHITSDEKNYRFSCSEIRQKKKHDSRLKQKDNFDKAILALEERGLIIRVGKEEVKEKSLAGRPASEQYRVNSKIKIRNSLQP
jgi:putative DNA primase/helicase